MANKFLTNDKITYELLEQLNNSLVVSRKVNKTYSKHFGVEGAKIGDTVRVRLSQNYTVSNGAVLDVQDIVERNTVLSLDTRKHIALSYTHQDRVLSMDNYSEVVVKPQARRLAHEIETDVVALFKKLPRAIVWDTTNATVKATSTFFKAKAVLDEAYIPDFELNAFIGPQAQAVLSESLTQLAFNNEKSTTALDKNKVGRLANIDIFMSPLLGMHVMGSGVAETAIQVDGASQSTLSEGVIKIKGLVGTLKAGDTFSIAGVYNVNPVTGEEKASLAQFVVTEDVAAAGVNIKFSPAMVVTGPYKNVSALPANNAAVKFVGTASGKYEMGAIFNKNAFALVTADLPIVGDSNKCFRAGDEASGVSIRTVEVYDYVNDKNIIRADILYGVNVLDENQGVKLFTKI